MTTATKHRKILKVATYNIHKGFSHFNRRMMIHELRERLRALGADIVFLQEVVGEHERHAERFENWPAVPQYEFLADSIWSEFAYGRNAAYDLGHHGNAVLSRFPILSYENQDVSVHALDRRGLLHCEIGIPGFARTLHCICVHLALHERGRRQQIGALIERLHREVPPDDPVIVAGDFNDWRNLAGKRLATAMELREAFRDHRGMAARSFPSGFPVLRLDRIYVRGLEVRHTEVHHGYPWSRISDHAALSAELVLT
jgi:endonuclease/exonuclease/phosphatase family metal-dependent hydrolase